MSSPPYFTDWLTAVGTVGAVIVALVLARWGDKLRSERKPALTLTITPGSADFQRLNANYGPYVLPTYYVRMSVGNTGSAAASSVEVFAKRLLRRNEAGAFAVDALFMPMNLKWSHTGDVAKRVIHPGVPKPCDLLMCPPAEAQEGAMNFILLTEVDPVEVGGGVFPGRKAAGVYRVELALAADDSEPVMKTVEIEWSGHWNNDPVAFFAEDLRVAVLP